MNYDTKVQNRTPSRRTAAYGRSVTQYSPKIENEKRKFAAVGLVGCRSVARRRGAAQEDVGDEICRITDVYFAIQIQIAGEDASRRSAT